jgi:hypothetical protein
MGFPVLLHCFGCPAALIPTPRSKPSIFLPLLPSFPSVQKPVL